ALLLEHEYGAEPHLELAAGWGQATEWPLVGAVQVGLHHHRVVVVVKGDELISLVGKGGARLLEIARNLLRAVVHVAGADELVAWVVEGLERRVVFVTVLRVHVLDHELLALAAKLLADGHVATLPLPRGQPGLRSMLRSSAGAEWLSAPTEIESIPVAAISATLSSVTPPEASRDGRRRVLPAAPPRTATADRSSAGFMLSSSSRPAPASSASWTSVASRHSTSTS